MEIMEREDIYKAEYREKRSESIPLASVIIPCYNAAKTLTRTFCSLETQTCDDFEVFVIDDGSTDETLVLAKKIQSESKFNVEVIAQEHAGVSAARNKGLKRARGKYIFFLDSDDIYHRCFVEIMTGIGEKTGVDFVVSHQDRDLEKLKRAAAEIGELKVVDADTAVEHFMSQKRDIHFGGLLYRRKIIDDLSFTNGCVCGEDLEFAMKYMSNCKTAVILENKLYGYAQNPNSVTNTVCWNQADSVNAMLRTEEYLKDNKTRYLVRFSFYMLPRVAWTTAKNFAVAGRYDLFERLVKEYPIKEYMKRLFGSTREPMMKLSTVIYIICPRLFYTVIGWYGSRR